MNKSELSRCEQRLKERELSLKSTNATKATALLLADSYQMAKKGKLGSYVKNIYVNTIKHNKRNVAVTAVSSGAGIGTGFAVSSAMAGAATTATVGAFVAAGAITGGIAIGGLLLGIAIGAGIAAYKASKSQEAMARISTGGDNPEQYDSKALLKDLKYLLTNGEINDLARYHEKACESEKALQTALDGDVKNCGDAHTVAYLLYRHKIRMEEKLVHGKQMDHLADYKALVDMKISDAAILLKHLGRLHTINVLSWLSIEKGADVSGSNHGAYHYKKVGIAQGELRDLVDLKWKTWCDEALSNALEFGSHVELMDAHVDLQDNLSRRSSTQHGTNETLKAAFSTILHMARTAGSGDGSNVAAKVTDELVETLFTKGGQQIVQKTGQVSTSSSASAAETAEAFGTEKLIALFLSAGQTAATRASHASAINSAAAGSIGNVASGAAAGFVASMVVSALLTYVVESKNDSNNMKTIARGEVQGPERIWILRSMLNAGRIKTLYDSYKKTQESIVELQGIYAQYNFNPNDPYKNGRIPSLSVVVDATRLLYRIQKHMLMMLAMDGILTLFFDEIEQQGDDMLARYAEEGGYADRAIGRVDRMVNGVSHSSCTGMCYELKELGSNDQIKVTNRMTGVV